MRQGDRGQRNLPHEAFRARLLAIAVVTLLAAAIWIAIGVIRDEQQVTRAEDRLEVQSDAIGSAARTPAVTLPFHPGAYPPRARMADALLLARQAQLSRAAPERQALLGRAAREIAITTGARPHWGEAWAIASFIDGLRFGGSSAAARHALVRSYADAPYLRYVAGWRVRTGFAIWPALDPETRRRLIDEAVWLARSGGATRDMVFRLARNSDGYLRLLLQWRASRAGDEDLRRNERRSPQ